MVWPGSDFRNALGSGSFDLFGNPPQILQFPAAAAMWHRGDVKEAEVVAESLYDPETLYAATEDRKPVAAALVGKVGYRFVEKGRAPVSKNLSTYWDPKTLTAHSVTGELTWDASNGLVSIDTPRTQAVIGFLSARPVSLRFVNLRSSNRFGAVWVTSMEDREPVRSARRLLVTAVGPARNTDMEYEKTTATSRLGALWHLKSTGKAPALMESIAGELEIRSTHARQLKAWTLDIVGQRIAPVDLSVKGDRVVLPMKPQYQTAYYEISMD